MMIEISHVEKVFVTVRNERIHALNDISFGVGEREFVTIVGPSGCGKSTLLKILAGLIRASSDTVQARRFEALDSGKVLSLSMPRTSCLGAGVPDCSEPFVPPGGHAFAPGVVAPTEPIPPLLC